MCVRIRIRFKVDALDANPWHNISLSYEEQVNVNDVVAQIKVLRLSKNKLREIPKTICKLSSLHTLSVRENNLIYLPLNLHKLQVTHSYKGRSSESNQGAQKRPVAPSPKSSVAIVLAVRSLTAPSEHVKWCSNIFAAANSKGLGHMLANPLDLPMSCLN